MAKILGIREAKEVDDHYVRMIACAKTFGPNERPYRQEMYEKIQENWYDGDCVLCQKYRYKGYEDCERCPLSILGMGCCEDFSLWIQMDRSETWKHWIFRAERFLEAFRKLPVRQSRSKKVVSNG